MPLGMPAEAPALLATAIQHWSAGQGDMAFTQQTRTFLADGQLKDERIERYDPSLPDSRRWRLIEVNGQPASEEQRLKWEGRKNRKPRRKVDESPSAYLNLDEAVPIGETPKNTRFRIPLKQESKRLLDLDDIDVVITVDKQSGIIAAIGAALREPMRVLLGVARITDLDVNLRISTGEEGEGADPDEVESGSTARVKISKLGRPVEYSWSDFKRVTTYSGP
jgi:hypothetical protein